jgi:diguanylate cyclase (GGDEF)-like protein
VQRRRAGRLWHRFGSVIEAEMRWPSPNGPRPAERLLVAPLSGLAFFAVFHGLLHLATWFAAGGAVSLFFPIAGLCLLFGFLFGPLYLPVPILAVVVGDAVLGLPFDRDFALHVTRQALLYGGAGVLLRIYQGRHAAAGVSGRLGSFLLASIGAVSANLAVGLVIFGWSGSLLPGDIPSTALVFFLGDLSGLLLVVPPALLLADGLLERRHDRREAIRLRHRDWLLIGGLFALAAVLVLLAIFGVDHDGGVPGAMTPALLPILIGAMLFGYTVGVGLFSLAAALLLMISAVVADAPSGMALQTVLIVCCIATLTVGAATSDRARLIARLDASVAERTRQLDARNAVLSRFNAELRAVAATDHLTGLANRRAFEAALRQRLALCGPGPGSEPEQGTGLLILDIDRFKRINDDHGHAIGDQSLIHVARLLEAGLRGGDLLARVGGEEFAVLCAAADAEQLAEIAERLRRMVRAAPLQLAENAEPVAISVSVGGALAGPGDDMDSLLRAADRALYAAKRAGRDRSRIAQPPKAEPARAVAG